MKKATREQRELAFLVYKEFGGRDVPQILERLRRYGLKISAQTLHKWKRQENWKAHTGDKGKGKSMRLEEGLLQRLLRLIETYYRRLDEGPKIDPQATYALVSMIKTVMGISGKMPEKVDPEEMRLKAEEILETEFGIKR